LTAFLKSGEAKEIKRMLSALFSRWLLRFQPATVHSGSRRRELWPARDLALLAASLHGRALTVEDFLSRDPRPRHGAEVVDDDYGYWYIVSRGM
jgi:hypothetical protein